MLHNSVVVPKLSPSGLHSFKINESDPVMQSNQQILHYSHPSNNLTCVKESHSSAAERFFAGGKRCDKDESSSDNDFNTVDEVGYANDNVDNSRTDIGNVWNDVCYINRG